MKWQRFRDTFTKHVSDTVAGTSVFTFCYMCTVPIILDISEGVGWWKKQVTRFLWNLVLLLILSPTKCQNATVEGIRCPAWSRFLSIIPVNSSCHPFSVWHPLSDDDLCLHNPLIVTQTTTQPLIALYNHPLFPIEQKEHADSRAYNTLSIQKQTNMSNEKSLRCLGRRGYTT